MAAASSLDCIAVRAGVALSLAVAGLAWSGTSGLAADPASEKPAQAPATGATVPLAQPAATIGAVPVVVGSSSTVIMGATGTTLPSLADIVQRVSPAVVSLIAAKGLGSGFVIDSAGFVVTNNHVIQGSTSVEVRFGDGRKFKARIVGTDEPTDVALLKIDGAPPLPSVRFGDDRTARVGDWVLAVGNPFGFSGTVTAGIISARGRDEVGAAQFTDYLQLDAAITSGNSGGPTFDMSGRVIGMNTLGYVSPTGERIAGLGFAIPATTVRRVVDDLKSSGSVTRGFLGVQIESLSDEAATALGLPNSNGAIVTDVIPGSPAEKAGIKRGDVVLKINGTAVKDNRDLSRRIAALQAGQTATFTIWRDSKTLTISVTVAKRDRVAEAEIPAATGPKMTSLGLGLQTITDSLKTEFALKGDVKGVLVTDIDPIGDAAIRGLRVGDRIVGVGTTDVNSLTDINLAIEAAKAAKRSSVLLFVVTARGGKGHVPVKIEK
ncbi:MAG: trypsin-like peptidase domain-containing protein [Alphaproteobacteria bacterium]|nr:trypsin-like peptidase domain-containing protein [Alphaproteobacteria bacterium]